MKKILTTILLFVLLGSLNIVKADDDKAIAFNELPKKAQAFISTYFNKENISYAKQDTDWFDGDYEVYFTNGDKVEFNKKGEWKEIKIKSSNFPEKLIPQSITDFIKSKYPDSKIFKCEKNFKWKMEYEVKLSSGLELIFDSKGKFLRYDD